MRHGTAFFISSLLSMAGAGRPMEIPAQFPDSLAVLSQLGGKAQRILRVGLRDKKIRRAEIIDLDLERILSAQSVNLRLFNEGNSSFRIIRVDSSDMAGVRILRLKSPSGRLALFAITEKGVTGKIYSDLYNPYTCKIIPAEGSKHLLMELAHSTTSIDGPPDERNRLPIPNGAP